MPGTAAWPHYERRPKMQARLSVLGHMVQRMQRPPRRRNPRSQSEFDRQSKQAAASAQIGRPLFRMKQRLLLSRGQGTPSDPPREAQELSRMVQPAAACDRRQRPTPPLTSRQRPEQQSPVPRGMQGLPFGRQDRSASTRALALPGKTAATPAASASRSTPWREVRPFAISFVRLSNRNPSILSSSRSERTWPAARQEPGAGLWRRDRLARTLIVTSRPCPWYQVRAATRRCVTVQGA